jgi:HPt (histidine-containing phosphotransfer) domain-containing protein
VPAAPAALPPVDPAALAAEAHAVHAHLRELTGVEDLGFIEEVLASYLRADLVLVHQIQQALAAGDALGVAKAVHKLKSSSGILGANTLAAHCAELEGHARLGRLAGTEGLVGAVAHGVRLFHRVAEYALALVQERRGAPASGAVPAAS